MLAFAQAGSATDELAYPIQRGDTLIGLGQRLLRPEADWRELQRLNGVAHPRRLRPGGTLRIPLALLREEPTSAEVLHVHGGVWLERAGQPRQPLAAAAVLHSGDRILVDAQSSASLRYADGSRSVIGPETNVLLDRLSRFGPAGIGAANTAIQLDAGQLDTRVTPAAPSRPAPRFELKTPVANLGVRGTDFRARAGGDAAVAEVLEGRVAIGAQASPASPSGSGAQVPASASGAQAPPAVSGSQAPPGSGAQAPPAGPAPQALAAGFGTRATPAGVAPPRRLLPAPDISGLPDRLERLPLAFTLPQRPAGARFRVQVLDAGGLLLLDGLFDDTRVAFDASPPDGSYELRVRSSDADGVEGFDARRGVVLKARPEPPLLQRPRSGERLSDSSVTLAWTAPAAAVPQPVRYRVQVADNAAFAPLREQHDNVAGTELALSLPPGRWFWRVASIRPGSDIGPLGDAQSFDRDDRAPAPAPPRETADGRMLSWPAASPGSRYQVQVARDEAFTDIVLDQTVDRAELLLPRPAPGTYHVRVRALSPAGLSSGFGSVQRVEVVRSWPWLWLLLPLLLVL